MLPLCLVTGFLGTGKTSILKHIVQTRPGARLVFLVNEFSSEDIDGAVLLATENPDVVRLPGGSIFCKCLVTEFIARLKEIPLRFPDAEGVVVEASGMANPKVVETMLAETRLDTDYTLSGIIAVVDRRSFTALRHTLPNILAQIESADIIVANKADLSTPEQLDILEASLRELNPRASILRSIHGRIDLDLFGHIGRRGLQGEFAKCRDPLYSSQFVPLPGEVDLPLLRSEFAERSDEILRAKGFLRSDGKEWHLDFSTTGLSVIESAIPPQASTGLAVIFRGDTPPHARLWLDKLGMLQK